MLNYRFAELSTGKRWCVYFYALNPATEKLERVRYYLDRMSGSNKTRYAKNLINSINDKLEKGWNPFINEKESKQYTSILKALKFVLDYKLSYIREASKANYTGRMNKLTEWIKKNKHEGKFIFQFKETEAIEFMNFLMLEEKIKGRTFNNYLIDYRTFFNLLSDQKFITYNPFHAVKYMPETEKEKQPFTSDQEKKYYSHLLENDYDFFIISCYTYYCALRPKEITMLKVRHVDLIKRFINVPGEISKNKKSERVPLSDEFFKILHEYLKDVPEEYYLCGKGFKPGPDKIAPTRIAEHFRKHAIKIGIPDEIKFYSLKDTVAEKLDDAGFGTGVIRDLFRHSSIATTDNYMRGKKKRISKEFAERFPVFGK